MKHKTQINNGDTVQVTYRYAGPTCELDDAGFNSALDAMQSVAALKGLQQQEIAVSPERKPQLGSPSVHDLNAAVRDYARYWQRGRYVHLTPPQSLRAEVATNAIFTALPREQKMKVLRFLQNRPGQESDEQDDSQQ